LRAEGFFCNLYVLYGDLGIGKFFSAVIFYIFWSLKPWIRIGSGSVQYWIRIGIQPKMLDPDTDPDEMNADPQPWKKLSVRLLPWLQQYTVNESVF
jgi:hypothetical protein